MTKRIFLSIFLTAFSVVLISVALLLLVNYGKFNEREMDKIWVQNQFAVTAVESLGLEYLESVASKDYRLTWIGEDGEVFFDSHEESEQMVNHRDRVEFQQAMESGYGWDVRESETLVLKQIYTAIRLNDGSVLRMSSSEATFFAFVLSILQPLLLALGIAFGFSFVLANYLAREIIRPLHGLNLDNPTENLEAYEEITPLLQRIKGQYQENDRQLKELTRKKVEFEVITRDMDEGLMILGSQGEIFSINQSATNFFQIEREECLGHNFLTVHRGIELQEILTKALTGEHSEGVICLHEGQFQVSASPMLEETGEKSVVTGVVTLLFDVTKQTETEQIRREFTANVSHELKTPLHTISGCAELMSHNLVKSQDIPQFSQQIYKEAQRLIRMVEEIISLSRLDEGAQPDLGEEVDLYSISKEVMEKLQDAARNSGISLGISGESAKLRGSYTLLSGIIHNLCENAIKYNRPEGSVTVIVRNEETKLSVEVADTGIGVSEKDQNLIFQRFYRVDKSRSNETGGTGLGLSIVKHAVNLHHGQISMESTLGVGTSILVEFPKMECAS